MKLTPMERRVVRLVSLGCTVKQVAVILGRSVHTVDNHKTRAMRKLGVHNVAQLTRQAIKLGISSLDDSLDSQEQTLVRQLEQDGQPMLKL